MPEITVHAIEPEDLPDVLALHARAFGPGRFARSAAMGCGYTPTPAAPPSRTDGVVSDGAAPAAIMQSSGDSANIIDLL